MKINAQTSRRTDANTMAQSMVTLAQAKAKNRFGCETPLEANSFALGYITTLLAQVAAASPAGMRELEGALKYAKGNQ